MATAVYAHTQQYMHPSSSSATSYSSDLASQHQPQQPAQDDQYISTFFCKALYDYQSTDDSSLSFRKGDVIEVLTRLESGWWDGLLADERGWFPSNYVTIISDEEADVALAEQEMDPHNPLPNGDGPHEPDTTSSTAHAVPSLAASVTTASSRAYIHDDQSNWLEGEMAYGHDRAGMDELAATNIDASTQSSDFWVPQVTSDGQVSRPRPSPPIYPH
jgi:son of sevenless-like protein